jgi:hypothetical protein
VAIGNREIDRGLAEGALGAAGVGVIGFIQRFQRREADREGNVAAGRRGARGDVGGALAIDNAGQAIVLVGLAGALGIAAEGVELDIVMPV